MGKSYGQRKHICPNTSVGDGTWIENGSNLLVPCIHISVFAYCRSNRTQKLLRQCNYLSGNGKWRLQKIMTTIRDSCHSKFYEYQRTLLSVKIFEMEHHMWLIRCHNQKFTLQGRIGVLVPGSSAFLFAFAVVQYQARGQHLKFGTTNLL